MSSFARHSARASAAVAGIAALGLGIAAPAFAAPSLPDLPELPGTDAVSMPDLPGTDALAPTTDAAGGGSDVLSDLPDAFAFQMPGTFTDPEPVVSSASVGSYALPDGSDPSDAPDQTAVSDPDPSSFLGTDDVSSSPSADMIAGLSSMTSGNDVGSSAGTTDY